MHDLITRAYAALASIHPLAPWLVLLELIFLPQYLVRKYRPTWWEWAATFGWRVAPETTVVALALKVWQGLPSVLAGALFTAYMSNGDPRAAFYGALLGAAAPLRHELMKRIPNNLLPYVGGSYPAASTAPRGPTPPVPPALIFLLAFGVSLGALHACGGNPEIVRAPESGCAGFCPVPDASDERCAGSVPAPEPDGGTLPSGPGALLVVLRSASGVEHAILCGGEVSTDLGKPQAEACPYDHDPDAGRGLLKLDRGAP